MEKEKVYKQQIQNEFDLALKQSKGGNLNDCYCSENVQTGTYYAYYTKQEWDSFLKKMPLAAKCAYENGGGQELIEHKDKTGAVLPPKMASYASSSRFIYELLCDNGVVFEQKLPTGIRNSTSNMDGCFLNKNIFIEAKCHEIYKKASPKYKVAYRALYELIQKKTDFEYAPKREENDAPIKFYVNNELIDTFDLKQTIAHILGIAYACMNGIKVKDCHTSKSKTYKPSVPPTFVYLVYNPEALKKYLSNSYYQAVMDAYNNEINTIKELKSFFKELYKISLIYLKVSENDATKMAEGFKVVVADQTNIKEILS